MGRPRPWQLHYTYPTTGQTGVVAFAEQDGAERQAREILASTSARGLPVVLTTGHRDQGVKAQHAADVNAVRIRREARPGSLPYGMTLDVFVSVPNPDDPHDWPIFEGPAREAGSRLIAGSYAGNIDDVEGPDDADPVAITLHVDDHGTVSIFLADEQPDSDDDRETAGCSCGWRGRSEDADDHPCTLPHHPDMLDQADECEAWADHAEVTGQQQHARELRDQAADLRARAWQP